MCYLKVILVLGLIVLSGCSMPAGRKGQTIELIRDRHFQNGFILMESKEGAKVPEKNLTFNDNTGQPEWNLFQWNTKSSLAGAVAEKLPSGAVQYRSKDNTILVSPAGSDQADLILGADSRPFYNGVQRVPGQRWPHLLIEQEFDGNPRLGQMSQMRFYVEVRLLEAERFTFEGYDTGLHAGQYQAFITISNVNTDSPGHGDYLWFGILMYDDRVPVPGRWINEDGYTKKLIFSTGAEVIESFKTLNDKQWVTIDYDMLPFMKEALQEAWGRGYLKDSQDLNDYGITTMNMGWEMPGIHNASVQTRDISIKAILLPE